MYLRFLYTTLTAPLIAPHFIPPVATPMAFGFKFFLGVLKHGRRSVGVRFNGGLIASLQKKLVGMSWEIICF